MTSWLLLMQGCLVGEVASAKNLKVVSSILTHEAAAVLTIFRFSSDYFSTLVTRETTSLFNLTGSSSTLLLVTSLSCR